MLEIPVEVDITEDIDVHIENENDISADVDEAIVTQVGGNDYEKLRNKPQLNGETIIGNMNEIDPTVPSWAKNDTKPDYTADEVGAVDEDAAISLEYLASLFED